MHFFFLPSRTFTSWNPQSTRVLWTPVYCMSELKTIYKDDWHDRFKAKWMVPSWKVDLIWAVVTSRKKMLKTCTASAHPIQGTQDCGGWITWSSRVLGSYSGPDRSRTSTPKFHPPVTILCTLCLHWCPQCKMIVSILVIFMLVQWKDQLSIFINWQWSNA